MTEWDSEIEPARAIMMAASSNKLIAPALHSGAIDNVVHPDDVPDDVIVEPNLTGQHFVNASGGT